MSETGSEMFYNKPAVDANRAARQRIIEDDLVRIGEIGGRIAAIREEQKAHSLAVGGEIDNSGDVSVENGGKNSDVREVNTATEEGVSPDSGDPAALLMASLKRQRPVVMDAEEKLNKAQNPQL